MSYIEYGGLVRNARIGKGLNQTQVAREVGVSQSYISQVERGERIPEAAYAKPLHDFLGIPLGDYFAASSGQIDKVEQAIVRSSLTTAEQDVVLTVYGHIAKRDSLHFALILRLGEKDQNDS